MYRYGMTEASPGISVGLNAPSKSCGYLLPNTQVRIVAHDRDNRSKNLGPREMGEIYIRGPQVMKGYYKNLKATAESMDGDWCITGDMGYYTEEGELQQQM